MSFFISNAYAAAAPAANAQAQGSPWGSMVIMAVLFVGLYFLMIRPQSKRAKEHRELVNNLNKGDEVITNGGIIGKITKVSDDFLSIAVADELEIKIQKGAISSVLPKGTLKSI